MKRGAGKNKGSTFERYVCKMLSLWVSKGTRGDLFWRSASSGAVSSNAARFGHKNRSQGGDISSVAEAGCKLIEEFSIECKHVRDLMIFQGLSGGFGNLVRFWKQAKNDASRQRKRTLLIAKQNNVPMMIIGTVPSLIQLVDEKYIVIRTNRLCGTWPDGAELGIVLLDDLLKQPCPYS